MIGILWNILCHGNHSSHGVLVMGEDLVKVVNLLELLDKSGNEEGLEKERAGVSDDMVLLDVDDLVDDFCCLNTGSFLVDHVFGFSAFHHHHQVEVAMVCTN
jgi:hypothetical protein